MRKSIRFVFALVLVLVLMPAGAWGGTSSAFDGTRGMAAAHLTRHRSGGIDGLTSSVQAVDDNIPGVPVPASPVSGTLSSATNSDDVFAIHLDAGERLDAYLTADAGNDFAIFLFDSTATDVSVDSALDSVAENQYFDFTASTSGTYYIDLYASSGAGAYVLDWALSSPTHNTIAAAPHATSPVQRVLSATNDPDDVVRVTLNAGDTISIDTAVAAMFRTGDFNEDLFLLGPSAVDLSGPVVASSTGASYTEHLDYAVPVAGDYFIHCKAVVGSGHSVMSYTITPRMTPNIYRSPSASTVKAKRKSGKAKYTLTARLTGGNWILVNYPLYLQYSKNGKSGWKTIGRAYTNSSGMVGFKITAKKAGSYYYRWYAPATTNTYAKYSNKQRVNVK